MKKILLTVGTVGATIAPLATTIACGSNSSFEGGIFTEYVRSNDMTLSLGVASEYHARSDLATTRELTNEGYLDDFAHEDTKAAKRYNGGDKEYFTSLEIGMYIARNIDDSNGYFENVKNKHDVLNSNEVETVNDINWISELDNLAETFDKAMDTDKYSTKATDVIADYNTRMTAFETATENATDQTVILVRGNDDETRMYDGIIPMLHTGQMYGLDNVSFPEQVLVDHESTLNQAGHLISGKSEQTPNQDLENAFAKSADIVIYLKTPYAEATDETVTAALQGYAKDGGEVIVGSYDDWYLPFRGAAIGAHTSIDNMYKDIFDMDVPASDWKDDFKQEDLEFIYIKDELK